MEITIHTVIHGAYIRFWPTLHMRMLMLMLMQCFVWECAALSSTCNVGLMLLHEQVVVLQWAARRLC